MKKYQFRKKSVFSFFVISTMLLIALQVMSVNGMFAGLQNDKYKEMWQKVEKLEKDGLPKSALEVVEQILQLAKIEKNTPQIYKAFVHKMKFEYQTIDYGPQHVVNTLREEADKSNGAVKSFLQSLYAEMLWGYYNQNKWQITSRTYTGDFVPEDLATWDARRLNDEIANYYLKSIENIAELKKLKLDGIQDIIVNFDSKANLRTNAYDLLAFRAITYFSTNDAYLTDLSNTFHIDKEAYFSPLEQFIAMPINTPDEQARKYRVVKIFQSLLAVHLSDNSPEALVDIDLMRLKYMRSNSVMTNTDTLYFQALHKLQTRFTSHEVVTVIDIEIAKFFKAYGETYNHFTNPSPKEYIARARNLCIKTSERFPNAPYTVNLKELVKEIDARSFALKTESNVIPNDPVLMQITYKNVGKLYCKILDVTNINIKEKTFNMGDTAKLKYFNSLAPLRTFEVDLKDEKDYQSHSTEVILDGFPIGQYIIMASFDPSFKIQQNKVDIASLNVTDLSYVYQRRSDYSYDFFVLNRKDGSPISGVKADAYFEEYNYNKHMYESKRLGSFTSDASGHFTLPTSRKYRNVNLDFSLGKNKLSTGASFYQYESYNRKRTETKTTFFTDRAIYRPGQTLYFKGIIYETDGETYKIKANTTTTVFLYDPNYQIVGQLTLTSNEFGSFHGEFLLPEGGITGQMRITNSFGTSYFRVEEYKRPKFEVKFEKIEQFFRLNEKIEVKGNAMAYAGYAIDGAKVVYSVTRSTYYPYRYFWWWYPPTPAATVLKQGELITNEDGKFNIDFIAEPEPSIQRKYQPAFIYTVKADVTDINGETRSSSTSVHVGYKSMVLSTDISEFLNTGNTDSVKITASNLNGNPLPAKGKLVISSVQPDSYLISRPWDKPDRPLIEKEEFKAKFPLLPWDDENRQMSWKKGNVVFSDNFDTEKQPKIHMKGSKKWDAGWYHLMLSSVDPFGEKVEYEHYFRIYNSGMKNVNYHDAFWTIPEKITAEPGEIAKIIVGSSAPEAKVLVCVEHKGKITEKYFRNIGNSSSLLEFPVKEHHRGNFTVHLAMVQHNRVFTQSFTMYIPHTDKKLDIRFETFRDKLLPGQEEEWRLLVSGPKGEKAMAEMAAVLYDASLDAFASHSWHMFLGYSDYASMYFNKDNTFGITASYSIARDWYIYSYFKNPIYPTLNTFGLSNYYNYYGSYYDYDLSDGYFAVDEVMVSQEREGNVSRTSAKKNGSMPISAATGMTADASVEESQTDRNESAGAKDKRDGEDNGGSGAEIELRTNFNETAFFYPQLRTNEKGEIVISFTVPESLTKWKMLGFAHTQDLKTGHTSNELVTQKELMVTPNLPRFFRENDKMVLQAKITNLTDKVMEGKAKIQFFDAMSLQPIDHLMKTKNQEVSFTALAGQSASVSWGVSIPSDISAITCRITAVSDKHSDGEEHTLPVLINRMLVTESMPLPIRSKQTKEFKHEKLINSGKSNTLKHHNLTLEFTANPAWYAVQALPYIMEYPYECAEQVFSRYYANVLASHIVNSKPEIKAVFDQWANLPDSEALWSNLEKNQELKALILEETPWVREAKNESERKRRVALLFDFNRMSKETDRALRKLKKLQKPSGGWVWFEGFPPDRYITQHIISGFGHLDHLNVMKVKDKRDVWQMIASGVSFIDKEIVTEYETLKRWASSEQMKKDNLSYMAAHYLYTRSFFNEYITLPKASTDAYNYYMGQAKQYWLNKGLYSQGMIALFLHRSGDKETPGKILKSLDERSIKNEEMGMFWQDNASGYYWWQAPIETQAILIEAFHEAGNNLTAVDDMKTWLLKQKQVQDWKTTKATVEAIYVLLLTGTNWLATEADIEITVGNHVFDLKTIKTTEAGTGYFKTSWNSDQITPSMGNVKISKRDEGVSWGALYWQYFEQLDKITPHETPLKLNKKLFIEKTTSKGKELVEIKDGAHLKVGDKVIVRVELRVDRDMEYVHMKDMRAAGFEPINVLSQYKWQGGLGYYESTRDAATNFFMNRMNKGTYVFEYPLRASIAGDYSNGITTIQCMYAPEFTSHSEGIRVVIEP